MVSVVVIVTLGITLVVGPANIDIFGGSGQGATGKVILGNFISKFDKEDMFGTLSRTASIIGVDITNPGEGYAEGPINRF